MEGLLLLGLTLLFCFGGIIGVFLEIVSNPFFVLAVVILVGVFLWGMILNKSSTRSVPYDRIG